MNVKARPGTASTPVPCVGARSKEETIDLFARHVSSGKVGFFTAAGIDFVPGRQVARYIFPGCWHHFH